jgi:hypothetical protein
MFVPYIWLDNPMSLASGREVLGFAKTWGTPTFPDGSGRCTLTSYALAREGDRAADHLLLEIDRIDDGTDTGEVIESLADIALHAGKNLAALEGNAFTAGLRAGADILGDLLAHRLNSVFLKQFPEVEGSREAALQDIVETAYTVRKIKAQPIPGTYRLTVHDLFSQPLFKDLGLASQDIELAYRSELDFDVHQSRVLWRG